MLKKRIVNLNLPVDCQLKLFDQTILPILLYGSDICSLEKLQSIEKAHLDFLNFFLNSVGLTYVWLENSANNADWLCKEVENDYISLRWLTYKHVAYCQILYHYVLCLNVCILYE